MTAKKMADIFFSKFSELISDKSEIIKTEKIYDVTVPREKKSLNKILIYSSIVIITALIVYSIS